MQARGIILAVTSALLVTGCAVEGERVLGSFYREAGSTVDNGHFGNATMRNTLAMTQPEQFALDLAQRFATEVDSTITFEFDSAVLDTQARTTLAKQATWIKQFPEVRFRVYGHTDKVGSAGYNKALGLRRARAAVNFLVAQGISRSRLEAVASFGETQPVVPTPGRERRNRRTVTEVSGFVENHPTVLDGRYAEVIYRGYVESALPRSTLSTIGASEFGGSGE